MRWPWWGWTGRVRVVTGGSFWQFTIQREHRLLWWTYWRMQSGGDYQDSTIARAKFDSSPKTVWDSATSAGDDM